MNLYCVMMNHRYRNHNYCQAVPRSGHVILGRTLPSLLDEACEYCPNDLAFNQWRNGVWTSWSNHEFRFAVEEVALGLLSWGLRKGDRLGLFMQSDVNFCLLDMGSLLANLVNVPIHLRESSKHLAFILSHAEVKVIAVSDLRLLQQIVSYLDQLSHLERLIIADVPLGWQAQLPELPSQLQVVSLDDLRICGQTTRFLQREQLRSGIAPGDLATIVYTSGAKGNPLGVMLSHENMTANILTAFAGCEGVQKGDREVVLSYLPLSHVFARTFLYGHINYGHCLYLIPYKQLAVQLRHVRPTILLAVPFFLNKMHRKLVNQGNGLRSPLKDLFVWGLSLAQHYEVGMSSRWWVTIQRRLADLLIYRRWREALGGRLKFLICGGASLSGSLTNLFCGAGINVLQGYGLTEASAVVAYNRTQNNRAGTVGLPLAGVEVAIAKDGEICVRSPYVMQGYYKDSVATQAVIDQEGWLHTGDLGAITTEGYLKVTDCKKPLFKLSTGKYVTPLPLEHRLRQSSLVHQAVAVGAHRQFCAMLIFPDGDHLKAQAQAMGLELPLAELLQHPKIKALYQTLVDATNQSLPQWSTIKRFRLIDAQLTIENGLLDREQKIQRAQVRQRFAAAIATFYEPDSLPKSRIPGIETAISLDISLHTEPAT